MAEKYQKESYLKEFKTKVKKVNNGKFIVLEDTIFYPSSGGQLHDTGVMVKDGEEFNVVFVGKFDGSISHEIDRPGLNEGDEVICKIDWDRRHKLMRYHTAAHIISGIIMEETGAKISGNQLYEEKARIDFNLDEFDREQIMGFEKSINDITTASHDVNTYFLSNDDDLPESTMMSRSAADEHEDVRIVEIADVNKQMCGGTHVKNTKEIGKVKITKIDNKGKSNRRVYFVLED